jgi:uncharacterized protein
VTSRHDLKLYSASSPRAALMIGHGAGAGQTSPFMVRVARGLATRGISIATFDFPYMKARRSAPDRAPVLEASWREAIAAARQAFESLPLFIGGKSMGGRMASHVAAQGEPDIRGLVFFGYPLHPPGKPDQKRDAHLPRIAAPMLFVQGSRDTFGTTDEIRQLLPSLQHATLYEVAGGDHSLKTSSVKAKQDETMERVMDTVAEWIEKNC